MPRSPVTLSLIFSALACGASLVSDRPDTPFKLATFEARKTRVGMALGDRMLDLNGANAYVEKQLGLPAMRLPMEMRELIEQYPALSKRMYQIANYLKDRKADGQAFAFSLDRVAIKAPIKYPYNLMNMAANYWTHAREMGVNKDVDQDRDDPFIFAKSPRSCIVDPGTPFYIPEGRDRIDWEGELAVIVSKPAFRVSKQKALDYVFGYSIMYEACRTAAGAIGRTRCFRGPTGFRARAWMARRLSDPSSFPRIVTHPHDIRIVTRVDGVVEQDRQQRHGLMWSTRSR